MRILITKLSSFGDVIAAMPAVTDAVAAGVEVDWLVDSAFAHVAALHPGVSRIFALEDRKVRHQWRFSQARRTARRQLKSELRGRNYDRVVDLQGLLKSALPSRWAGAPVHGYDASSIREPLASRLYNVRHPVSWTLHAVERNRALLAAALDRTAPQAPGDFGLSGVSRPAPEGLPQHYGVILHAASWPSKLWPEERWRSLIGRRADLPLYLPWGDEAERERAERLATGFSHVHVLEDRLTDAPLAGFLANARVVVGLDSGLMHLANALGAPTIWLFGSTSPERTGPYGAGARVLRSANPNAPCLRRDCRHEGGSCMEGIAPNDAAAALDEALAIR